MTTNSVDQINTRMTRIYGAPQHDTAKAINRLVEEYAPRVTAGAQPWRATFSEKDVVLITYGDSIRGKTESPLAALHSFIRDYQLPPLLNTVHLLPFFPFSSDDGFSVIDYLAVASDVGTWDEIQCLSYDCQLMFDLVCNHTSQQHQWFQRFLQRESRYGNYYIGLDERVDVESVTRPRSHALLTPFETTEGTQHVWTTFSSDQVDLNFGEPNVLVDMLQVLLEYISRGARIIRLDAIAYLWKALGTSCIHLPQTHEVVKLMRDVAAAVNPQVLLLTETNVPHAENVIYFGDGDEAHMVYQFSLPPLLLDAFLHEDATIFMRWLAQLESPPPGATYFNFTASHDGIGVRPLEGLISDERLGALVDFVKRRGGLVSMRRMPDGSERPYELNITYVDAMAPPHDYSEAAHAARFLASQGIMLAMAGMPAVYIHSLLGTQNDLAGVEASGHARRINRRKMDRGDLDTVLGNVQSLQARIHAGYRKMLAKRVAQPAFHPQAPQRMVALDQGGIISFLRTSMDGGQSIVVLVNLRDTAHSISIDRMADHPLTCDLLNEDSSVRDGAVTLQPFRIAWLANLDAAERMAS